MGIPMGSLHLCQATKLLSILIHGKNLWGNRQPNSCLFIYDKRDGLPCLGHPQDSALDNAEVHLPGPCLWVIVLHPVLASLEDFHGNSHLSGPFVLLFSTASGEYS